MSAAREKRWFEVKLLDIRESDRVVDASRALTLLRRQERQGLVNGLRFLSMSDGSLSVYGFRCETDEEYRFALEREERQRAQDIERWNAFKGASQGDQVSRTPRLKWPDVVSYLRPVFPNAARGAVDFLLREGFREVVMTVKTTGLPLTVPGVGTFYRRTRKARRVTLNGVESVIPEMNEIGFRLSKGLK